MRVRTEARRETILNTAAEVFMEMGYERASMAEIAARVGGSKATLYGYFPSKEELFMGVVLHKVGGKVEPAFKDLPSLAHEDPRSLLTQFGERFLSAILTPEAIGLKRLIIAHMTQSSVMERFWAEGPQKLMDSMEAYLAAATTAGRLQVKEPKVAALQMLALYEAEVGWHSAPGPERTIPQKQIKQIVGRAVDVFLAAYGKP